MYIHLCSDAHDGNIARVTEYKTFHGVDNFTDFILSNRGLEWKMKWEFSNFTVQPSC
jgi:hypothetical protein